MQTQIEIQINAESDLPEAAQSIINFADSAKIMLFYGEMGSGKTTLIKAIAKCIGSKDHFSSPTFSIINEYQYPSGKIFHMDLYRVDSTNELFELGISEYLDSGSYCLIEWPQLAKDFISTEYVTVQISVLNNIRYIRCAKFIEL